MCTISISRFFLKPVPAGNEMAHDDVFLESAQPVDLAEGCRFGEDARGILKGCRRDEAIGLKRSLGDAEQHGAGIGGLAALFDDALVFGS